MKTHTFTVILDNNIDDVSSMTNLEDRLFEAGCDDSLLCTDNQEVSLVFDREAESIEAALESALADLAQAGIKVSSFRTGT